MGQLVAATPRWTGLKRLDLSNSGLVTVPEEIDDLPQIEALVLDNNKLTVGLYKLNPVDQ
jgi:Leucine-rich repeat (LRR) protein